MNSSPISSGRDAGGAAARPTGDLPVCSRDGNPCLDGRVEIPDQGRASFPLVLLQRKRGERQILVENQFNVGVLHSTGEIVDLLGFKRRIRDEHSVKWSKTICATAVELWGFQPQCGLA